MKIHGYTIVIEPDEGNTFHGYVPAFSACHTWGETKEETIANVKEALELCIEYIQEDLHEPLPPDIITQTFSHQIQFA